MLVEHHAVEAHLFGQYFLVKVFVEQLPALDGIEIFVWVPEKSVLDDQVVGNVTVGTLSKVTDMHSSRLPKLYSRKLCVSRRKSASFSISGR
jgi:hypothetical protein